MRTHLYAYGSICRGEVDAYSDVDVLACTEDTVRFDRDRYSVYPHDRIALMWRQGDPYAWNLHMDAKLLFSSDGQDFLRDLGEPAAYRSAVADCATFKAAFNEAWHHLRTEPGRETFHLSSMFIAIRKFATSYSFTRGTPVFSRRSPLLIDRALPIQPNAFDIFARARILSTRGVGAPLLDAEIEVARSNCSVIGAWLHELSADLA